MGHVQRDILRTARQYDADYPYEVEGLAVLLRDIYRLTERQWFQGDIDAATIMIDLKMALDSGCLTPRMRQCVALKYFLQITEEEAASILGIAQQSLSQSVLTALQRLSENMKGEGTPATNSRISGVLLVKGPLETWLNDVAALASSSYDVPDRVFADIQARFPNRNPPDDWYIAEEQITKEEYPCYTEDQFRWKDRRSSPRPEIFTPKDKAGAAKVAIKLRDGDRFGNEWKIEKKSLFVK
ncbi:hypothetical protein [uncultured Paenibacillus sp.]|uniref:hypothetical protein n=1 Tax=uncultured Paenibacillus sp. TaxID=227322 RepID=UPI0015ABAB8F|nr:hypothetical protein [uncultured Paenibacillus sp.]DAW22579.1 MAG TPA: RNA polymerase sigma-F factor [Caudoviricetes sp.]